MVHDASEARRPTRGWWTVHWPAVPLAFLEITGVPGDEVLHLVPSFEAALQARWHAAAPSLMAGWPSHSVNR